MKPKFNNPKQRVLWNVLTFGTGALAGFAAALFSHQHNMAGMITSIVAALAILGALHWWGYRTRRTEVANEIMEENRNRRKAGLENDTDEPQRVNIYGIRVHNSPAKVIMEVLTVFLLVFTWGMLWAQHNLDKEHIMPPLIMTIASIGALIAARFPFMMANAEEQKDINQISLSVKKEQTYALIFAVMAVLAYFLEIQWGILGLIVAVLLVDLFFDRKKKAQQSLDKAVSGQGTDKIFDPGSVQVGHDKEEIVFYAITGFIILITICLLLLSYDVIKDNLERYGFRVAIILGLAYLAINQLVKAVKFARTDEELQNIRQFHLGIRENRVSGVMFALMGLMIAVDIYHRVLDPVVTVIAIIAMFFAPYFIFKYFIKKAK